MRLPKLEIINKLKLFHLGKNSSKTSFKSLKGYRVVKLASLELPRGERSGGMCKLQ